MPKRKPADSGAEPREPDTDVATPSGVPVEYTKTWEAWSRWIRKALDNRVTPLQILAEMGPPRWPSTRTDKPEPSWDRETRTLSIGGTICRRFTRRTSNQIKILEALQSAGWPERSSPNPLDSEEQLHQTIRDFNKSLSEGCPFRLVQDHNRVGWRLE
jgi:hypothetical protein